MLIIVTLFTILSIVLYIEGYKVIAITWFVYLYSNCFYMVSPISIKYTDLALLLLISLLLVEGSNFTIKNEVIKWMTIFVAFCITLLMISCFLYDESLASSFRAGRNYLAIIGILLFYNLKRSEINNVIFYISILTIFADIIYILQTVLEQSLLYNSMDEIGTGYAGKLRFYNLPSMTSLVFYTLLFNKKLFPNKIRFISIVITGFAILLTQHRSALIGNIIVIVSVFLLYGTSVQKRFIKIILCISVISLIAINFFTGDFSKVIISDINNIVQGNYNNYTLSGANPETLSYRIALLSERLHYIFVDAPFYKILIGLGFIPELSYTMFHNYNFKIGIYDSSGLNANMLFGPDIAWANLFCQIGLLGIILYLLLLISLLKKYWNYRIITDEDSFKITFCIFLEIFITSFTSASFSNAFSIVSIIAFSKFFQVEKEYNKKYILKQIIKVKSRNHEVISKN